MAPHWVLIKWETKTRTLCCLSIFPFLIHRIWFDILRRACVFFLTLSLVAVIIQTFVYTLLRNKLYFESSLFSSSIICVRVCYVTPVFTWAPEIVCWRHPRTDEKDVVMCACKNASSNLIDWLVTPIWCCWCHITSKLFICLTFHRFRWTLCVFEYVVLGLCNCHILVYVWLYVRPLTIHLEKAPFTSSAQHIASLMLTIVVSHWHAIDRQIKDTFAPFSSLPLVTYLLVSSWVEVLLFLLLEYIF